MPSLEDIGESAADLIESDVAGYLSPYHYIPTHSIAIIFLVLFSLSTLIHLVQVVEYRTWWLLPTAFFCGCLEILGWWARLWSSTSPFTYRPFEIQIVATIIAPTPLLAANFLILERLVKRLGPIYSRLSPKWYGIIFCSCDFVSLVVQSVGGGIAAKARNSTQANLGAHIMLGGIGFQFVAMIAYAFCGIEFFVRYFKRSPIRSYSDKETNSDIIIRGEFTTKLKYMVYALVFMSSCLFIRAIYRGVELSGGWDGPIISTEVYFNVFDGVMIILAIYTMNLAHPGILLATSADHTKYSRLSA